MNQIMPYRPGPTCLALALAIGASGLCHAQPTEERYGTTVEVSRMLVECRVVDDRGRPVAGLGSADFQVAVDGRAARVEDVEWVTGERSAAASPTPGGGAGAPDTVAPGGRLIVMFFQTDFASSRLNGLFTMVPKAARLVEELRPEDRVAVLSFDSHLKLQLDFTNDRAALARVLTPPMLLGDQAPRPSRAGPSIARHLERKAALKAASPERGLLVTAQALQPIPGPKTLLLFGWGLGHFTPQGVVPDRSYPAARLALARARVTVLALDITDADYHSLEVGLEQVAADTGGFYAKTHLFPDQAITRVEGALAGHYVLVLERPEMPRGIHALTVTLREGVPGNLLVSPLVQD